jgi:hypothetical protein
MFRPHATHENCLFVCTPVGTFSSSFFYVTVTGSAVQSDLEKKREKRNT